MAIWVVKFPRKGWNSDIFLLNITMAVYGIFGPLIETIEIILLMIGHRKILLVFTGAYQYIKFLMIK